MAILLDGRSCSATASHIEAARRPSRREAFPTLGDAPVVEVDPKCCRVWKMHGRLQRYVTTDTCREEIENVRRNGQLLPALGRRIRHKAFKYELIYGVRRRFIAETLGIGLKLRLAQLSDEDALLALYAENCLRKNISPYEQGLCFRRWLEAGMFPSQRALANALDISKSKVSRLLQIAELPDRIIEAFGHPDRIKEYWATELLTLIRTNKACQLQVMNTATKLKGTEAPPAEVFRKLCAIKTISILPSNDCGADQAKYKAVRTPDGELLFTVRHSETTLAFVIPISRVNSAGVVSEIKRAIGSILAADVRPAGRSIARAK